MHVENLEGKKEVFHNMSISSQLWSVWKKILKTNKKFCEKKEQDIPYFLLRINQTPTYLAFGQTHNSCIPLKNVVRTQQAL